MQNPWLVLNVPPDAGDDAIRDAWRLALQAAPPEKDPQRFQAVQEAFTAIRDARSRANFAVKDFENPPDSPAALVRSLLPLPGFIQVPDARAFHAYLEACVTAP